MAGWDEEVEQDTNGKERHLRARWWVAGWLGGKHYLIIMKTFHRQIKIIIYLEYYPILYTNQVIRFILYLHNLVKFGRTQANIPPLYNITHYRLDLKK